MFGLDSGLNNAGNPQRSLITHDNGLIQTYTGTSADREIKTNFRRQYLTGFLFFIFFLSPSSKTLTPYVIFTEALIIFVILLFDSRDTSFYSLRRSTR